MDYQGKHVLVLGLGESGLAMARWLARCGARVRVADTRAAPARLDELRALIPEVEFIGGPCQTFPVELLDGIDFAGVSPGLAPRLELIDLIPAASERDVPLWGEIEIFAQALAALRLRHGYAPKIIAISGTNGKTTVTSLVGLLCARAGLTVQVAGNISPAALDVLRDALDKAEIAAIAETPDETPSDTPGVAPSDTPGVAPSDTSDVAPSDTPGVAPITALPQVWVLELSSFQLHTTHSLQADAATVLNITQDHLDWHGDIDAYAADKARIFAANTVRVLNRDDARVMRMAPPGAATSMITFGSSEPNAAEAFGLLNERGMQWLCNAVAIDDGEKPRRKNAAPAPVALSIHRLMPADALRIRGQHNAVNALAALALCRAIGLPFAPLLHGLRDYRGEPHRVELINTIGGVEYYDDSKGTNVGATVAALAGLGAHQGGSGKMLVLIAGGEGKGQDFSPLAEPVARFARAVLLIGRDAEQIRAALEQTGVDVIACPSLEAAVQRAAEIAKEHEAVLLSPACASFDMFNNYAHRAQVFIDAVHELGLARGEVAA